MRCLYAEIHINLNFKHIFYQFSDWMMENVFNQPSSSHSHGTVLQIYQFGDGAASNFAVFEGAERLLPEFRLLCQPIHHPKDELTGGNECLPRLPVTLMPEQAQVLLELGFAQLRRIIHPAEVHSDSIFMPTSNCQNEDTDVSVVDDQLFRERARHMVIGRKIKARKRKAAMLDEENGIQIRSAMLKVRRLDRQKYASELMDCGGTNEGDDDAGCSPAELDEAMAELISRREAEKKQQQQKMLKEEDDGLQNFEHLAQPQQQPHFLVFVSPSCSTEPVNEAEFSTIFPSGIDYAVRLTVFRDLWRKGFLLASGAKFGCDFLAYEKPPSEEHSAYMVLCQEVNRPLRPLSLIGVSRAGTQVKKRILLAMVSVGAVVPYYMEMNWWKGDGGN